MSITEPELTLLQRREIEAKIAGPLIRGFIEAMGREAALEVVGKVIGELARNAGDDLARRIGDASLIAFSEALDVWRAGGALELDVIEQTADRLSFNVTRCRYAELYRTLGLADLGGSLSCARDFALIEGFNPDVVLERTQTLMEGASHCDFRFRAGGSKPSMPKKVALASDIRSPSLLYLKAGLFVVLGIIAAGLILLDLPSFKVAGLLALAVWAFARAYYFVFYVIQHYVDPSYKFAGLSSFFRYLREKPKRSS